MPMDCQNGILFSNKNYELYFNLNKIIKGQNIYVTYAKECGEFFTKLMNFKPNFVIFDLDTINLPYDILKTFVDKKVFNLKGVFFFSTTKNYSEIDGGNNLNYSNLEKVLDVCNDTNNFVIRANLEKNEQLSSKITKMLIEYGFSTKHLGFVYLKEILLDVLGDNSVFKSFNGSIYPKLACRFSASVASVERNIRNAITYVYKNRKEQFDKTFQKHKAPSIREVVFYLVDLLIVDVA